MPSFRITIAYDGTPFVGWQRQAEGTSIQGLIEDALAELDGRQVAVAGAGRTDAGVHALAQVELHTRSRHIARCRPSLAERQVAARDPGAVRGAGAGVVSRALQRDVEAVPLSNVECRRAESLRARVRVACAGPAR